MKRAPASATLLEKDAGDNVFAGPARWGGHPGADLAARGYRVDEYFIDGLAHCYIHDPHTGGAMVDPAAPDPEPYRTRAFVVRPIDPAAFSGHVLVEALNPSLGHDLSMMWPDVADLQMADGDVFIGFTYKKRIGTTLALTDPERYGTLHIGAVRHRWDIVSDALILARAELLDDLGRARSVILTGGSQASSLIHTYLREGIHAAESDELGHPIADGYVMNVHSGGFLSFGYPPLDHDRSFGEIPGETLDEFFASQNMAVDDPRRIAPGADVPVVHVMSEQEVIQEYRIGRPDSDAPGDLYRAWHIGGRGHGTGMAGDEAMAADWAALAAVDAPGMWPHFHSTAPHPDSAWVLSAMLEGMRRWREEGVPMPRVERLVYDPDPLVRTDAIGYYRTGLRFARDSANHPLGGVRYPMIEHPIVRMLEIPGGTHIQNFERLPMDDDEIASRYGSRERWLALATAATDSAIEAGLIRPDHRHSQLAYLAAEAGL